MRVLTKNILKLALMGSDPDLRQTAKGVAHPGFVPQLTSLAKPSFYPWTGAPGSPKRTWTEKTGRSPTTASVLDREDEFLSAAFS